MKRVAILGSTGSIGRQTVDVIKMHPEELKATVLVANRNVELMAVQARELKVKSVVVADESRRKELVELLSGTDIEILSGREAINEVVRRIDVDIVVAAMVGFSGFGPTLSAIEAGKDIALANKETLVVAGSIVMQAAKEHGVNILPVDSEHSAIFQCLQGERHAEVDKIILTASGGPFRGWTRQQMESVSPIMALRHPNWSMGAKVTIDSASMMNKGLEAIEARWLFDVDAKHIDIVVHPQSIVHSMVAFADGAVKAQLGVPDMRLPIQYALLYPTRKVSPVKNLDFGNPMQLTFERPDLNVFRNLAIALNCLDKGGTAPCVMNGANEIAVEKFLIGEISFLQMTDVVEQTLARVGHEAQPDMQTLYDADNEARNIATEICHGLQA